VLKNHSLQHRLAVTSNPVTVLISSLAVYYLIGNTGICQLQQSELFGFFSFGFQGKQQWGMGWLWLPAD
jgi:hypothetical protein